MDALDLALVWPGDLHPWCTAAGNRTRCAAGQDKGSITPVDFVVLLRAEPVPAGGGVRIPVGELAVLLLRSGLHRLARRRHDRDGGLDTNRAEQGRRLVPHLR